jgi:hypothetical protein
MPMIARTSFYQQQQKHIENAARANSRRYAAYGAPNGAGMQLAADSRVMFEVDCAIGMAADGVVRRHGVASCLEVTPQA